MLELNRLYNMDCMEGMEQCPDKYFELAIVDPPYGIDRAFTAASRISKYGQTKTVNDLKPNREYFDELFRVSQDQIIWGYNHLSNMLPTTKEFIFWFKHQPEPLILTANWRGHHFKKPQNALTIRFLAAPDRMAT